MLVVVAILAIIFILGGGEISKAWKRQKLQSASTDIKVLFQRALPEMQRRNMQTFVQVGPLVTAGAARYMPMYLIGDADQDGAIAACFANPPTVACPDLLIDEYDIVVMGLTGTKGTTGVDQEFSLSELNVTQVESTLWSDNSTALDQPARPHVRLSGACDRHAHQTGRSRGRPRSSSRTWTSSTGP